MGFSLVIPKGIYSISFSGTYPRDGAISVSEKPPYEESAVYIYVVL